MSEKRCQKCKVVKPLSDYYRRTKADDGLQNRCKVCQHKDSSRRGMAHRATESAEERAARNAVHAKWQRENKDKVYSYLANWRSANPEKAAEYAKVTARRSAQSLSDNYVRSMLSSRSLLRPRQFPQALVNVKRQFIALNREIKAQEQK